MNADGTIDQSTVTIDRAIQILPSPANPNIRFINIPAGTNSAFAFAAQVLRQRRGQLRFPLPSATPPSGIGEGLRAEMRAAGPAKRLEIRLRNGLWELPPNLDGKPYQLAVGNLKLTLKVDANTNHQIISYVNEPTLQSLLAAMDVASAEYLTIGDSPPLSHSQRHVGAS